MVAADWAISNEPNGQKRRDPSALKVDAVKKQTLHMSGDAVQARARGFASPCVMPLPKV